MRTADRLLVVGGSFTGIAAVLHLAIVVGGPDWYRFFGAGEQMARLATRGSVLPTVVTVGIAAVLGLWMVYAFSGAGLIRRLPLLRSALPVIASVYLMRGVLGIPLVTLIDTPYFAELRSRSTFMVVTSVICTLLGLCYAAGALAIRRRSHAFVA